MVIDLDWFKSNQKKIYNIILTEENNDWIDTLGIRIDKSYKFREN
jgi:hypothetical protein